MDTSRLSLLFHTLKYLRVKQIYYRLYYLVRNRFSEKSYDKPLQNTLQPILWADSFSYSDSFYRGGKFVFLNLSHVFENEINWNFDEYGKLWTYNLNYFDFLNQKNISEEAGLELIYSHIRQNKVLEDAKEAFPISLRGINWIKFLSRYRIQNPKINQALFSDYNRLMHNLEYHLLGNHLLENGFSLFFGSYYFQNEPLYKKARQILTKELKSQVLHDGAHFELSPMYHQIVLHRLLDCIALTKRNPWKKNGFEQFLRGNAKQMLSWLQTVTFSDGNIPMVNDSAYGIAPESKQLFNYGKILGLEWKASNLSDSGYRKFCGERYELFVDVGKVGPTYQPGHAHADTFSFELYSDGQPIIVDTGVSTYEKDELRQAQRGTAAHNTVIVDNINQTQVWGGFRVAKRAKISNFEEGAYGVKATHNGYKDLGVFHTRTFNVKDSEIQLTDELTKGKTGKQKALFHLHPQIGTIKMDTDEKRITLVEKKIHIRFEGNVLNMEKKEYQYATGFYRTKIAERLVISFYGDLRTHVHFR